MRLASDGCAGRMETGISGGIIPEGPHRREHRNLRDAAKISAAPQVEGMKPPLEPSQLAAVHERLAGRPADRE